ncbi:MAG: AsmA-like C-terminal region-containing protein [Syntrophorhabdaceae bacterium]|nr:AsmA-like C-terminal region-containing protein [Syntrophorhabdaceae bacterium]
MKKISLLLFVLVSIFILSLYIIKTHLPFFTSFAFSKLLSCNVHISKLDITYERGALHLTGEGIKVEGDVEVEAKSLYAEINVWKGLYLKRLSVSNFHAKSIVIKDEKLPPIDFLKGSVELKNGVIYHRGERYVVDYMVFRKEGADKRFDFKATLKDTPYFHKLNVSGRGKYSGIDSEVEGDIFVSAFNLAELSKDMKGVVDTKGVFLYKNRNLEYKGDFGINGFFLKDRVFNVPLILERTRGRLSLRYFDKKLSLNIREGEYKETWINLDLVIAGRRLVDFTLSSGPIDIKEIKEFISLDVMEPLKEIGIWDYLIGGTVKAGRLSFGENKPITGEFYLNDLRLVYQDVVVERINGVVLFDEERASISRTEGYIGTSRIYDLFGVYTFTKEGLKEFKAKYAFDVRELPRTALLVDFELKEGQTYGAIEFTVEQEEKKGFRIRGEGDLIDVLAKWKGFSGRLNGHYSFDDERIFFNPLNIKEGETGLMVTGRYDTKASIYDLAVSGQIDVDHIKPIMPVPSGVEGEIRLKADINGVGNRAVLKADVVMDELKAHLPGILKKDRGIKSRGDISIIIVPEMYRIENISCSLDGIRIEGKGEIKKDRITDMRIALKVFEFEKVAFLFPYGTGGGRGSIEADLSLKELKFPVDTLPYIDGYIKLENGSIHLPIFKKPLNRIDIFSDFKGDVFNVDVRALELGNTIVNRAILRIEGLEAPRFYLDLDLEKLDPKDFERHRTYRIERVKEGSILKRTAGDFSIKSRHYRFDKVEGDNLSLTGFFNGGRVDISELKGDVFEGGFYGTGSIDVSPLEPVINLAGFAKIKGATLLKTFEAKTEIEDKLTMLAFYIVSKGNTIKEMVGNTEGNLVLQSQEGTILRWNFLSKLFGLMNIQAILRGKSQLEKEGLPYSKMGATFNIKEGILSTEDFVIDGPSMLITGEGNVDLKTKEIDGNIAVSPLVTIDWFISSLPILKNILKEKDKGFLYASYKVKGKLNNPDVTATFVKGVWDRFKDIFRNLFYLPGKLYNNGR